MYEGYCIQMPVIIIVRKQFKKTKNLKVVICHGPRFNYRQCKYSNNFLQHVNALTPAKVLQIITSHKLHPNF